MSYAELYWITRIPNIGYFFGATAGLAGLGALITCVVFLVKYDSWDKEDRIPFPKKIFAKFCATCVLLSVLEILTPSTKDLALIMSGHFATNSDQMQKLPDNLLKYLNTYLEESLPKK